MAPTLAYLAYSSHPLIFVSNVNLEEGLRNSNERKKPPWCPTWQQMDIVSQSTK